MTPARPLRVLHCFANHRWTGPAEPALNLALALRDRGVDIAFACSPGPAAKHNAIVANAEAHGLVPIIEFDLLKHRKGFSNWRDRTRLRVHLKQHRYDLIHCHLDNDHRIAQAPACQFGVPLVRSSYEGAGTPPGKQRTKLLRAATHIVQPSTRALTHDADLHGVPREKMTVIPNAIDTTRFDPGRKLPDMRARFNVPNDATILGIVARMQTHRHYHDLLAAYRAVIDEHPQSRLVIVGRGTKQDAVARQPVQELGLEDNVVFTGYLSGDDYVAALAAFDIGVYLVPGSDGTCRAVREAMAMRTPMIVADRGMLREIVPHREAGLVTDGSVDALTHAMRSLLDDPTLRKQYAHHAAHHAHTQFALEAQANAVQAIYEAIRPTKR